MHKVCDIRNPNLRTGLSPRDLWVSYARDLSLLMDRAVGEGSLDHRNAHDNERKAA
jgi:hypothetical protein